MKLTVTAKDGAEAVVAVFGGGSLLGEGCIDNEAARRTHSAEALSDSQITEFTKGSFLKAIKQDPAFALELIEYLLRSNAKLEHELAITIMYTSEQRLAHALLAIADLVAAPEPKKLGRVNQQTLAAMIGTSRQHVNSLLRHFESLGYVSLKNGLRIHESLRALGK
jgi:CRP-like cAMP-binding protein